MTALVIAHVVSLAPVISTATLLSRDNYSLKIQITRYSTTGEMRSAAFAFAGTGTLPAPETLNVQALFDTWYLSETGKHHGGAFTYTQSFDFTTNAAGLTSVSITLTNAAGSSNQYKLTF